MRKQKILVLGWYDKETYMRGRILYEGLTKKSRVTLFLPKGKGKYSKIIKQVRKQKYDAIIATGKFVFWTAWLFAKSPVIYEAAVMDYDNLVLTRNRFSKWNPVAWLIWLHDSLALNAARLSFVDTKAHIAHLRRHYLALRKMDVVHVGAYSKYYYPAKDAQNNGGSNKTLKVGYFGTFIELHGIDTVLDAAKLLKKDDVKFTFFGKGAGFDRIKQRIHDEKITNIRLAGFIPDYKEFHAGLSGMDVLLGVFADQVISRNSVPHKIFESAAMGKPVITAKLPATHELFSEDEIYLVPPSDAKALANAIRAMRDPMLRKRYAKAGHDAIRNRYYEDKIASEIIESVKELHE